MYHNLSGKPGRQVWHRAVNFLDLPARRAGTVLHSVSIAARGALHNIVYMGIVVTIKRIECSECSDVTHGDYKTAE